MLIVVCYLFNTTFILLHTPIQYLHNTPILHTTPSYTTHILHTLQSLHTTGDRDAAPDPELERKLREMEANQLNAWEEKEKLSQALEAERQANMNNVISEMMNGVKEQKVCSVC